MKKYETQILDVRTRDEHYIARKITDFVNGHRITSYQSFVILLADLGKNNVDLGTLSIPDIENPTASFIRVYSLVDLNRKLLVYELENMCLDLLHGCCIQCKYVFSCGLEFLDKAKDIPENKEKRHTDFTKIVSFEPSEYYSDLEPNKSTLIDACLKCLAFFWSFKTSTNPCILSFEELKKQRKSDDDKLALCKPNKTLLYDINVKMMRQCELYAYKVRQTTPMNAFQAKDV